MNVSVILLKLIPFTHKENGVVNFTLQLEFGDWIVTTIEMALIVLFLFSVIKLYFSFKKDKKSIELLAQETSMLKEKGFNYYNDFLKNVKNDKKITHLWGEFDESLIKKGDKLENSLDADYFFNSSTLASHVGSKFYSAIPGILLGIGLLGTFFALYVALIELNLDGNGQQLQASIRNFIGMVGIKFTASVWGMFLSVLFTFFEKTLEGKLTSKIKHLQDNIDEIFKRQTAEQNLFKIANESEQQTRAMNSLAETLTQRISEQFNPFLTQMNSHLEQMPHLISSAIGETLSGPLAALQTNAQNAADSQSDSLESIVNTFIKKLDETAGDQVQGVQNLMAQTTQQLTELLGSIREISGHQATLQNEREAKMQELFTRTMTSFEEQMNKIQDVFGSVSKEGAANMKDMFSQQQVSLEQERISMSTRMQEMKETLTELSTQTTGTLSTMFDRQQHTLSVEREALTAQSENLTSEMQATLSKMANQNLDRDEKLQNMIGMIQNKHIELFDKNQTFAKQMEQTISIIMGNIVTKVTEVQSMINSTSEKLSDVPAMLNTFQSSTDSLKQFGNTAKEVSIALTGTVSELNQVEKSIISQLDNSKSISESMKQTATSAAEVVSSSILTAKELQSTYRDVIHENTDNLDAFGGAMSKWLSEYDKQVHSTMQNSLNEVQGALSNFANTLSASMGSLEDAIESINAKTQG